MRKKSKIILIISITIIALAIAFYFLIYNPRNNFGERCQTGYNLSNYEYSDGFKIDVPKNRCFVNACRMIGHRFRTHESYDSLNNKLKKLLMIIIKQIMIVKYLIQ